MFTDKEIIAYHNIKAPDELRERVLKSQKKSKNSLRFVAAVAACFVFIISGFFIISNKQSNIVVNGQKLTGIVEFYDTTSAFGRTVSSAISVPIEIKTSKNTNISVSKGIISINGSSPAREISISSSEIIWWEINPEGSEVFEMKISDSKGVRKVTLKYENAKITATKEKVK